MRSVQTVFARTTSAAPVAIVLTLATLVIPLALGQNGSTAIGVQENAVGTFTILDFPAAGVLGTTALGINNEGEIVGRYDDAQGRHGFSMSEDGLTTINFPSAVLTTASGINDRGTIVGAYVSTDRVRHAYQLQHGMFLSIDPTGSVTLSGGPLGINNRGTIVGSYVGQDGHTHGFAFRKGESTTIDAPNASDTFCNAINDKGEIVGGYRTGADPKFRGYILRGDKFTTIDRPDTILVNAIGINDEGTLVGRWAGADNVVHGYILRKGEFTDFDPPGFSNIPGEPNGHEPHDINEVGQIVGFFRGTDGRQHGYLLNSDENVGGDNQ